MGAVNGRKKYRLTQDMSYSVQYEHITMNINSQKGNGLLFGHTKGIYMDQPNIRRPEAMTLRIFFKVLYFIKIYDYPCEVKQ